MKVGENFKKLGQIFLDLVFPISCLVCGKDGLYLCANCMHKLPRVENQQCLVCQKPSPFGKTHPECVTRNSVDGIISALPYRNKYVKKIIEVLKYNFVSELAEPLAELAFEEIKKQNLEDYFKEFIIVPVPLHQRRFNWRGFNQADLLAGKLQQKLHCGFEPDLVTRIRNTKPQTQLNQSERKINIEHAFNAERDLSNLKILVVDDVVTSGATINEIAKLLKKQKAAEVWGLTTARG